jgi:hypothetical protein
VLKQDPAIRELLAECFLDTKLFAKTLFPDRFSAPWTRLHDQIFEVIDSGERQVVIAAPRGIGKTSIAALALPAKRMLFRTSRFTVYVSNSAASAELQTENLKHELASNQVIKELFGPVKATNANGIDESFSKRAWVGMDTLVYPRGSGQQIRGILYHNDRPDLFIIDDLEDTETITNEEQRKKRKQWFFADLMKAVSRVSKNYQIVYIDTLKHEDALLQDLLDSSDWLSLRLELFDDNYKSLAPGFVSDAEIQQEVASHREKGMLDVLYREYRNMPISTEDAVFKPSYFKNYEESTLSKTPFIENVIIVDPAKTVKLHSADSAVVGIGIDRAGHGLYVRDVVSAKLHPDELYDALFNMVSSLRCRVVGVEVTSLNEFITQPLKNEMSRRGVFFELIELKARGKKEERIAALAPYYRQGFIYHNPAVCGKLETQLMGYPRSKLWDVMDALAYVVEMLELGLRYFEPPDFDDDMKMEDEIDDLGYEAPLKDWRTAP